MPSVADNSPWPRLATLPVLVESYVFERLSAQLAHGFQRVTTRIRLRGAGVEGIGEDVSPYEDEADTLHVAEPALPLGGEWTLGSLCERLGELRDAQWPVPPRWGELTKRTGAGSRPTISCRGRPA